MEIEKKNQENFKKICESNVQLGNVNWKYRSDIQKSGRQFIRKKSSIYK